MDALYKEFMSFVTVGDEGGAKKFITEHFASFPEAVQEKLAFAFLLDEIKKGAEENSAVENTQQRALAALAALKQEKDEIENQVRIAELKDQLHQ